MLIPSALSVSVLLSAVLAHPGGHSDEEIHAELALRNVVTVHSKRALDNCANSPAALALRERALARREATAQAIREKRGLVNTPIRARDTASLEKWQAVSHNKTGVDSFTLDTPTSTIFASNATCALVPETVIGPYYVEGELIRTDITDGQAGVPVHLDLQFIDIGTCAGVSSLLIDIWHCNSTGVYSGVAATGQGGLNSTHGRGVQKSDSDGVVQFSTLFPGHYTGRATHIHVMSTANATTLENGTFTGGTAKHIGQMYFDEALRTAVEATAPYNTNSQSVTTNAQDSIAPDEATAAYDPFLNYVMLGDSLSDGLLMWITIGLNSTADYSSSVSPAAHYYAGGGVAENNGMGGGPDGNGTGPGGPGGPGSRPGSAPTGSLTSGAPTGTGSVTGTSSLATTVSSAAAARRHIFGWR